MLNEREFELIHRRDEILRETIDLTSNIVQSLEQQQKYAYDTKENLHNQNLLLSLANDKMRLMNQDLTSVVNEMNEIDTQDGCLCCTIRKKKKKKKVPEQQQQVNTKSLNIHEKSTDIVNNTSVSIPELLDNNEQEKLIVKELNQMKNQLVLFQDQVKSINKSFEQGEEIIHQLENESNQYMNAITTALNKAEQVLGRKFIVNQEQQQRERKQEESDTVNKSV